MGRYKIVICYDGRNYYGFQRQTKLASVQSEIEKALEIKLKCYTEIFSSGRTDAGVHAIAQVAHFDSNEIHDLQLFCYSLNCLLPKDIVITDITKVDDNFHARYDAKRKTYVYKVYCSPVQAPLHNNYYHICKYKLDIDLMQQACKYFIGTHDFKSFMMSGGHIKNTQRKIYDLHIEQYENSKQLQFVITGNGFLHNMVRTIVGTLIDLGRGHFVLEDIPKIIEQCDRRKSGKTLESCGLYLKSVEY